MKKGVNVEEKLPEVTMNTDCALIKYFGPLKMSPLDTRKMSGRLQKSGGIKVEKRGTIRGSSTYFINSSVEPFLLRSSFDLPEMNLSNILNHCKIEMHNTDDKYCNKCRIHIEANGCTKRKVELFIIVT